jgi:hypothetical protein
MYKVGFSIMHASWGGDKRKQKVTDMVKELGKVEVVEAVKGRGVWDTARRAWAGGAPDETHRVVLQDDVILCGRFIESVLSTIEAIPAGILNYYSQHECNVQMAVKDSRAWYTSITPYGPAVCMPRPVALDFVSWADRHEGRLTSMAKMSDDARIEAYCKVRKSPVFISVPSLVEHDGEDSLWKNREAPRRAVLWAGKDFDPSSINWHSGNIAPVGWFSEYVGTLGKGWEGLND